MFNKPSFKFKKDDVFLSYLKANPKFKVSFYFNKAKINNGLDIDPNLYNSDVISVYDNNHSGSTIKPAYDVDDANPIHFFEDGLTEKNWGNLKPGDEYTGSYTILTSSLTKEYIIKSGGIATLTNGVSYQETLDKLGSLKNIYNYYRYLSPYFDFDTYLASNDGLADNNGHVIPIPDYISFISVPRLYKGNKIKEGTLKLSFYYTGSLVAEAQDSKKNGVIYETSGSHSGSVIGTVLYSEGLIILTASYDLNSTITDGYLSPKITPTPTTLNAAWKDHPKWVHFMSYESHITKNSSVLSQSYAPASSSYVIEFDGETVVPTYTMFCHADKNDLVWSNNPTYIQNTSSFSGKDYDQIYIAVTGSTKYEEREMISIKNIVSSSFINYSESFNPVTYISKIGVYDKDGDLIAVANLSTPVKKTTKQDYTFKLKLDL